MAKNLSKSVNILISELIALAAVFYFGQVFVIQQKRVGIVFKNNLRRSTNLFGRNHLKLFLIKKRRSADAQYRTAILSNWHTGGVLKNEKLFSKISLYSQEKNRVAWNSMKKRLQQRWFPVAKFLGDIYFAYGCFWTDFTKWLLESLFLDSRFQNHPDSAILRKYQSLSNQIFKYNYAQNAVFIFNP